MQTGFASSDKGLMYALAADSTNMWITDMHRERSQTEIYMQAVAHANLLSEIWGSE